jgi:hypothetical protein
LPAKDVDVLRTAPSMPRNDINKAQLSNAVHMAIDLPVQLKAVLVVDHGRLHSK